ncbi:MAG TPA: HEAT repeat domain-containing protein [Planctomycetaceae bacterium]|nr:HEAT repeat domain-containing protein [Planctomycetaceae bacterium]
MKRTLTLAAAALAASFLAAAQTAEDRAAAIIEKALTARNPETRVEGVKALGLAASAEPFATRLGSMLNDKDVLVRVAAVDALAEQKTARAIETIKIALDDRTPEVRFAAAKALFKLHDEAGMKVLLAVLNGSTKTSSGLIAEQVRDAQRTLESPKKLMLVALQNGMGLVPVPYVDKGAAAIGFFMGTRSQSSRAATALLLGQSQDPAVKEALRTALADKDAKTRAAAAKAIAMQDDPMLRDDLARMLVDKNRSVQLNAAAGFLRLRSAVPMTADAE